jgi:arsenite transporter
LDNRNNRLQPERSGSISCIYKLLSRIQTLVRTQLGVQAYIAALFGLALGSLVDVEVLKPLIPVALFVMLYPAMLDLRWDSIKRILSFPRMLLFALVINLVISPLLMFLLVHLFSAYSSPFLMVGLLLFGLIPCGGMVPAYTGMLGGNVNLAASVMALSLVLCIGTFPVWTSILLGQSIAFPVVLITKYLAVIIVMPIVLALLTRHFIVKTRGEPTFAVFKSRLMEFTRYGLLLVIVLFFSLNGALIFDHPFLIVRIIIPVSGFLVILIGLCALISRFSASSREDSIALTVSSAAKNNAVAMAVAVAAFGPKVALVTTIAGPMVQLPVMLMYIWLKGPSKPDV